MTYKFKSYIFWLFTSAYQFLICTFRLWSFEIEKLSVELKIIKKILDKFFKAFIQDELALERGTLLYASNNDLVARVLLVLSMAKGRETIYKILPERGFRDIFPSTIGLLAKLFGLILCR